jgi:hypothetical protein
VVFALPLNGTGPVALAKPVVNQGEMGYVGDAQGNVIGSRGPVWVSRMVSASAIVSTLYT